MEKRINRKVLVNEKGDIVHIVNYKRTIHDQIRMTMEGLLEITSETLELLPILGALEDNLTVHLKRMEGKDADFEEYDTFIETNDFTYHGRVGNVYKELYDLLGGLSKIRTSSDKIKEALRIYSKLSKEETKITFKKRD